MYAPTIFNGDAVCRLCREEEKDHKVDNTRFRAIFGVRAKVANGSNTTNRVRETYRKD